MIATLADRLVTVKRRTAYVVDPATAAAAMTVARQPVRASCLRVEVSGGTTGSGTVTLVGTVGGALTTVALTFSENGPKTTVEEFTALSSVPTAGLTNEAVVPTVSVQAVDRSGRAQSSASTVAASVPATFRASRGRWPVERQGSREAEEGIFGLDWSDVYEPRSGDLIVEDVGGDEWLVQAVGRPRGSVNGWSWSVRCTRQTS